MRPLALLALVIAASPAVAADAPPTTESPSIDAQASPGMFSRFDISLGLDGGGAPMFRDTPDGQLSDTSAFRQGIQLAMRFGDPTKDAHSVGLALGYAGLARSADRKLGAFDTKLLYAAGGATEVQVGLGYRVGLASTGFRLSDGSTPYSGPLGSVELRHVFLREGEKVPVGLAASLFGEGVVHGTWTTAFVGTRIEFLFRKSS